MIDPRQKHPLHPIALRIMHWVNAFAIIIMIGSGWKIYDDEALFGWLHFPNWMTIGGEAQGALQWHFLAMWILMLNGICYLAYGVFSGRFRRKLVPIRPREILANVRDALLLRLSHDDITRYNAVQKLLYVGIIVIIVIQVFSGWVVWKPMQLSELTSLFTIFHSSGFQGARHVHFFGMAAIVIFLIVHITLALIVPRTVGAMLTGGPRVDDTVDDETRRSRATDVHGAPQ